MDLTDLTDLADLAGLAELADLAGPRRSCGNLPNLADPSELAVLQDTYTRRTLGLLRLYHFENF